MSYDFFDRLHQVIVAGRALVDDRTASIAPELFELTALKQSMDKICTNYSIQASRVCIEKINSAKKSLDDGCNLNVVIDNLATCILEVRYRCQL